MWTGDRSQADSAARLRIFGAALKNSRWFFVVWTAAWIGVAVAYLGAVKPQFVASVDVKLEPRLVATDGPEDERHYHQFALDSDQADTELRLLRSERLLRPIFDRLQLADAPELVDRHDGFWTMLTRRLHRLAPNAAPYDAGTGAFLAFMDRVRALRLGLSYVFEISYRSDNPQRAAQVANAIAAAYVADRLVALRGRLERVGGPYRTGRAEALSGQIDKARAAVGDGAAPQDLPLADVQVLGTALPPLTRTYPKPVPMLAFTVAFALISGALLAHVPPPARPPQRAGDTGPSSPRPRFSS